MTGFVLAQGSIASSFFLMWLPEDAWVGKPQPAFGPQCCSLCLVRRAEWRAGSCALRRHLICERLCPSHFIFLHQHEGFLSVLANFFLGLRGWEDAVRKGSQSFRSLSKSSLSINLRNGPPGQPLKMPGVQIVL